jgi:hypothetical protein
MLRECEYNYHRKADENNNFNDTIEGKELFHKINVYLVKTNPMSTLFRCRLPSNYNLITGWSFF